MWKTWRCREWRKIKAWGTRKGNSKTKIRDKSHFFKCRCEKKSWSEKMKRGKNKILANFSNNNTSFLCKKRSWRSKPSCRPNRCTTKTSKSSSTRTQKSKHMECSWLSMRDESMTMRSSHSRTTELLKYQDWATSLIRNNRSISTRLSELPRQSRASAGLTRKWHHPTIRLVWREEGQTECLLWSARTLWITPFSLILTGTALSKTFLPIRSCRPLE